MALARGILEANGQGRQSLGAAGVSGTKSHRLTPVSDGIVSRLEGGGTRGNNFLSPFYLLSFMLFVLWYYRILPSFFPKNYHLL